MIQWLLENPKLALGGLLATLIGILGAAVRHYRRRAARAELETIEERRMHEHDHATTDRQAAEQKAGEEKQEAASKVTKANKAADSEVEKRERLQKILDRRGRPRR